MAAPFCSSGEEWDYESDKMEDCFKIFTDKTNHDVIMFNVVEGLGSIENRMSPRAAVSLGMSLVRAATGLNVDKVYKTYLNYIRRKGL